MSHPPSQLASIALEVLRALRATVLEVFGSHGVHWPPFEQAADLQRAVQIISARARPQVPDDAETYADESRVFSGLRLMLCSVDAALSTHYALSRMSYAVVQAHQQEIRKYEATLENPQLEGMAYLDALSAHLDASEHDLGWLEELPLNQDVSLADRYLTAIICDVVAILLWACMLHRICGNEVGLIRLLRLASDVPMLSTEHRLYVLTVLYQIAIRTNQTHEALAATTAIRPIEPLHPCVTDWQARVRIRTLVQNPQDGGNSANVFDGMSGQVFELAVAEALRLCGLTVFEVGGPRDFGADLIAMNMKEGLIAIQCKCTREPAGISAVQEAVAAVRHYKAAGAAVACISGFTESAIALAASNGVELWGLEDVKRLFLMDAKFSSLLGVY